MNEKRNLVIAGVGTGKTSTIIGKVGYLIKSRKCENSDILILAYNRSATLELQERIENTNYPSNPSKFIDQNKKFDNFLLLF